MVEISSSSPRPSIRRAHASDAQPVATSEVDGLDTLSDRFRLCLDAQKKEMLRALLNGPSNESTASTAEEVALNQLSELLKGSVMRAEGNSCLILGPRGSGKSRVCVFRHIPAFEGEHLHE